MKEIKEMVNDGVLWRKHEELEWESPIFMIPKKDNRIRIVSDYREVNMLVKRKPYPLSRIQGITQKRSGYTIFMKMDLSMQFYRLELDEESRNTPLPSLQMTNLTSTTCYLWASR